jgi:hypothetical protein
VSVSVSGGKAAATAPVSTLSLVDTLSLFDADDLGASLSQSLNDV